jgi:hypothetical protein
MHERVNSGSFQNTFLLQNTHRPLSQPNALSITPLANRILVLNSASAVWVAVGGSIAFIMCSPCGKAASPTKHGQIFSLDPHQSTEAH